jgi:peptidoglycan hydrolase-like protein with peptidoglycan-binding domain
VATPKDVVSASASLSHPGAERSSRRRLRQRVGGAMPTKKFSLLSVAMAGGLVLAGVTSAAIPNTGHTPTTHDSLSAANVASSSAVNLDDCPTLTEGYPPGGCVIQLQTELNTDNGTTTPVDGVFGPQTKAAVITFQQNHHIVPADGIVGPQTKAALGNPGSTSAGTPPGQLNPGQQITSGTQIASPDGKFVLQMQSDGNLVLRALGNIPLEDTHTAGHDGTIAVMQADGNFVLTAPGNIPVWASGTNGHPGTVLQVQDDGAVVLYAPGHQVLRVLFPAALSGSTAPAPVTEPLPATQSPTPASSASPPTSSVPAPGASSGSGMSGSAGLSIHCTEFGQNVSVHGVGLFNGTFCMNGIYSGTELTGLQYGWSTVLGSVCLWWVDFDVYGPGGSGLVYHNQGTYNPTCDGGGHGTRYSGGVPTPLPIAAPIGGQVCSTFWRQGSGGPVRVAGACQAITAKNG